MLHCNFKVHKRASLCLYVPHKYCEYSWIVYAFIFSKGFYIQPRAIQFSAPPISQSLLVNSSLHLSCGLLLSSSWLPSPVIHWYHNGEKMDVEGDELAISSAQLGDAGEYHCGAVDGNMTSAGQPVLPAVTISRKAHVNVIGKNYCIFLHSSWWSLQRFWSGKYWWIGTWWFLKSLISIAKNQQASFYILLLNCQVKSTNNYQIFTKPWIHVFLPKYRCE